jgi:beta-phosphoglucomutase-like phosphatase (HAD superfamily)
MLDKYLKKLGMRKYFKKIVGMDGLRHSKPNPEIYKTVMRIFGLPKANCLTFEDSSVGIESAKRAGIKAIGVATGVESVNELKKAGADLVLPNLSGLRIQMIYDLLGI